MGNELVQVLDQIGRDKGIDRNILINAIESAVLSASRKKYGNIENIFARFNEKTGEVELYLTKKIVSAVEDPKAEISLDEARKIKPSASEGEELEVKLESIDFGRIAAQTAKQIIVQKVREAERDQIYSEFVQKQGQVVNGIVQKIEQGNIIIDLVKTEGILLVREQIIKERYNKGDRIRVYVLEVKMGPKGVQILLSRTHPNFLIKLFEMEVPEIYQGIVEIKGAARDPGWRGKIAVLSHDSDVDAVGACVGMKGTRVQAIVRELSGEKIDIVRWSAKYQEFITNALSPAQISKITFDEGNKSAEVIVPDDQLSLAIGRKGQNVKLASKLTGLHLAIFGQSELENKKEEKKAKELDDKNALAKLENVGTKIAEVLFEKGYKDIDSIVNSTVEDLCSVPGIGKKKAETLIESAKKIKQNQEINN
ncbi:MAG: hypothetical protein A2149_02225 [Candidatus Schekmanbacteria bacterium RBG_16_38_11]|uniref:Transcription termination/antitermination protein NusA n=1 Tax=Candidatus Schekmanbacteria bacterium RBG_16_38_11 TaxID=1817880 RepID=A0A1F7RWG2_9BACT|nr:MAG: hypothetical protein A2149_02225 [Candidatus Schekmanbacteria bacterium RBG_16_38_11]